MKIHVQLICFIFSVFYVQQIGECLTTSGSMHSNVPCHFPFTYYGQTFNECKKTSNYTWCATGPEYKAGAWGYCNDNCPQPQGMLLKTYMKTKLLFINCMYSMYI